MTALSTATSDDEQAVSTVKLGPFSPRTYEMRPADTDADLEKAQRACVRHFLTL